MSRFNQKLGQVEPSLTFTFGVPEIRERENRDDFPVLEFPVSQFFYFFIYINIEYFNGTKMSYYFKIHSVPMNL